MQPLQNSNGERLACRKHLLASGWFFHLVELQGEPPNRRSELHVQPGPGHGRTILHFSRFSGLSGLEHGLIERRAHQFWSAAPQGIVTDILWCGSGDDLRARIGLYNGIGVIDDEQGIRKRLKHTNERLSRRRSDTVSLLCMRHSAVAISFTYPHISERRGISALISRV